MGLQQYHEHPMLMMAELAMAYVLPEKIKRRQSCCAMWGPFVFLKPWVLSRNFLCDKVV
jgi:hypothetical protein